MFDIIINPKGGKGKSLKALGGVGGWWGLVG